MHASSTDGFAAIAAEHRDAVFRFCFAMTQDRATAEDVTQETFLSAYRGFAEFKGEASIRTWLFTIARRAATRSARRRAGEPAGFEPLESLGQQAGWGQPAAQEAVVLGEERRTRLRDALATLPQLDREVIVLRDVYEMTARETAAVMKVSEAAVRTRLHRARLKLIGAVRKGDSAHGQ